MKIILEFNRLLEMGGFTMYLLFFASVFSLAIVLERICFLLVSSVDYKKLFAEVTGRRGEGENPENLIQSWGQREKGAEIFLSVLKNPASAQAGEELELALEEERIRRENHLPLLGTLAAVSPFLGLLGTVSGIIRTFQDIAREGSTNLAVVSGGVAEALITTFFGLLIAIFSVIFFNLFKAYNQSYLARARNLALKLLRGKGQETLSP